MFIDRVLSAARSDFIDGSQYNPKVALFSTSVKSWNQIEVISLQHGKGRPVVPFSTRYVTTDLLKQCDLFRCPKACARALVVYSTHLEVFNKIVFSEIFFCLSGRTTYFFFGIKAEPKCSVSMVS